MIVAASSIHVTVGEVAAAGGEFAEQDHDMMEAELRALRARMPP